ncbi:zinc finger protein 675-like isoform X1 [Drosophila subobscura]|uniref:zinc finger protein 675-like isoform X1 n=1 Tax=Drosophila subobscura TaxID=7241 RepID=UPI00155B103D|nr:zinc finger protein 675-like isoform X1 [Drosophila subobscura]
MFCVKTNHSDQRTINSAYLEIEESGTRWAMEETCRVCKGTSESFTNIFDEPQKWDTCIADMIAQCTGYEVSRGDLLSENICPPCLEEAVSAFNLKTTCEQSYKLMEESKGVEIFYIVEYEDWEPSDCRSEQSNNIETDGKAKGGPKFKCPLCPKSFAKKRYLTQHVKLHTGGRPYKCSQCSKSFHFSFHLSEHILSHTPFKCKYCSQSYERATSLRKHIKMSHA